MCAHTFSKKNKKQTMHKATQHYLSFSWKFSNTEDLTVGQLFLGNTQVRLTGLNPKRRFHRLNQREELTARPVSCLCRRPGGKAANPACTSVLLDSDSEEELSRRVNSRKRRLSDCLPEEEERTEEVRTEEVFKQPFNLST